MNVAPDPKPPESTDAAWIAAVRAGLDASVRELDAATRSRLNQARQRALSLAGSRPLRWRLPSAWLAAATASVALAVGFAALWPPRSADAPAVEGLPLTQLTPLEPIDAALLAAPEEFALYEDLAFYAWLAAEFDVDG